MKVFGLGLSRTGTTSLAAALNRVGIKTVHFPFCLYKNLDHKIIKKYEGFTDNPIPLLYKHLDKRFPGSKFILTTRREEDWLKSMEWLFNVSSITHLWLGRYNKMHKEIFNTTTYDRDKLLYAFRSHNDDVLSYFKNRNKDLLILELDNNFNYESLCNFLERPIVRETFPLKNKKYFMKIYKFAINKGREAL